MYSAQLAADWTGQQLKRAEAFQHRLLLLSLREMPADGLSKHLLVYSAVAGAAMGSAFFALSMARRALFDGEEPSQSSPAAEAEPELNETEEPGTAEELQQLVENAPDGAVVKATCEVTATSDCMVCECVQVNGRIVGQWRGTPQKLHSALSRPNTPRFDRAVLSLVPLLVVSV